MTRPIKQPVALRSRDRVNPSAIWRRFVNTAGGYDSEGPLDDVTAPITTYFPGVPARQMVLVTKNPIAYRDHLFPPATAVFTLHGPATSQHCRFMRRVIGEEPLLFFGDLDPMDLTTFGTLRAGGTDWSHDPSLGINVQYRGINDYIVHLAEARWARHAARSGCDATPNLAKLLIRMEPVERHHLDVLIRLMPDLQRLVGSRAFDLMKGGLKFEIEALSFDQSFMAKLMHRVLNPAWHTP